jgi:hypothetical protein
MRARLPSNGRRHRRYGHARLRPIPLTLMKYNVTHITLSKKSSSKPSLEFYSDSSGAARRVAVEKSPFRIGRAESADLRVESAEVSREHAEIVERNGMWLVRDLGSTNGTHVNGKRIQEALLTDGDIVRVAESELTFIASAASNFQRMVTQPIRSKKKAAVGMLPPEIAAMRMFIESTLWQAIPTRLMAAASLRQGDVHAYFAPHSAAARHQPLYGHPHCVGERYRELVRQSAAERALELAQAQRLFLAVGAADIESPQQLFASLRQLQGQMQSGWELGITISLPTEVDILRITDLHRLAVDHKLLVAFDEFQGNGGQLMHLTSMPPDYLVLAASMTKALATSRQPMRRLESLLAACEELAIKPILPASEGGSAIALCREIGFDLMLQSAGRAAAPMPAELCLSV